MSHEKIRLVQIDKYLLPHRLVIQYHDCGDYKAGPPSDGPVICQNCKKVVPWFFFKCAVCETYFIKDFRHPKFCQFYPTCWKHTLELPWEYCEDHHRYQRWANEQVVEPKGLNPQEFTSEELADVFDF